MWNSIKNKPMTYAGLVVITSAVAAMLLGLIDFATFEAKVIEWTLIVLGGAALFKASTSKSKDNG
jgi:hypothetical protein